MIPQSLVGLLLFVGAIGPGYAWVLVSERRRPRTERSPVLEAAELACVGLLATGTATLIVLLVARWKTLDVSTATLVNDWRHYVPDHPLKGLGLLMAIFGLSYGGTYGAARLRHRDAPTVVTPGYTVWERVFKVEDAETTVFATVELRDGRRFSGYVSDWDLGESERDGLALQAPIKVRSRGGPETRLDGVHFLVLQRSEVVWLTARWDPAPSP